MKCFKWNEIKSHLDWRDILVHPNRPNSPWSHHNANGWERNGSPIHTWKNRENIAKTLSERKRNVWLYLNSWSVQSAVQENSSSPWLQSWRPSQTHRSGIQVLSLLHRYSPGRHSPSGAVIHQSKISISFPKKLNFHSNLLVEARLRQTLGSLDCGNCSQSRTKANDKADRT